MIKHIELCTVFPIIYIVCVTPFISLLSFLFLCFLLFEILWVYLLQILMGPYSSTWGVPSGLKGLLHTLNATVIPTKVS